ncbi:MAG TPA: hypothetical protein VIV11_11500 [Kofleriaceae bacterium]
MLASPLRLLILAFAVAACARGGSTTTTTMTTPPTPTPRGGSTTTPTPTPTEHSNGQHDFDFHPGTWQTHVKRRLRPLTGSTSWVEYSGTTVVHPIWKGRANLVELDVSGPAGRLELLSLRLFEPETGTWSLHVAGAHDGEMSPPVTGRFENGRGVFTGREMIGGRSVLVRFTISDITPTSCRFEQAFSTDDGKTWEANWLAIDTRAATTR